MQLLGKYCWLNNVNSYYKKSDMALRRCDEPNPALWLATRVGKVALSCLLGIMRIFQAQSISHNKKSYFDQACSVKIAACWP